MFDTILTHILPLAYKLTIPIALAAIAGTISESVGVTNLGLEGMMLFGAFAAVVGSYFTGNAAFGVLLGMLIGLVVGLIHVTACVKFKAHQSVSGVAINLLASGLTAFLTTTIFGQEASPLVTRLANITVPFISKIPYLGIFFENQSPFFYILPMIVIISNTIFYRTRWGLRIIAIGNHPQAALAAGVNVTKYRFIGVMLSGAIAGLGGAYLSVSLGNSFVSDMVAGRGFMGLASNIFGGWSPIGSFLASFLFALAQSVRYYVAGGRFPTQIIQMIPYITTLVVLVTVAKRSKAPESLGKL